LINVALRKIYLLIALLPIFAFAQSEKNPCETLSKINALIQEDKLSDGDVTAIMERFKNL
jgi:hypothetical protein